MKKNILFTTILLISVFFCLNIQGQTPEYIKKVSKNRVTYWSNEIKSSVNNNTYTIKLGVVAEDTKYPIIQMDFTVIGDEYLNNIFFLHNQDNGSFYKTNAIITLDSGHSFTSGFTIINHTNMERTQGLIGFGVITFSAQSNKDAQLLQTQNIKKISLDGKTIDFDAIKFKSAKIIDGAYKMHEKDGFSFSTYRHE